MNICYTTSNVIIPIKCKKYAREENTQNKMIGNVSNFVFYFVALVECQSKAEDSLEFLGENQSGLVSITLYQVTDQKTLF